MADGPYRDQIVAWIEAMSGRGDPGSEFVLQVLADGVITAEEVNESASMQAQCMRDLGYEPETFVEDEFGVLNVRWKVDPRPDEEIPTDADACSTKWDAGILSMYMMMERQPHGEPTDDDVAACLVHEGLVPVGFTGRDLAEIAEQTEMTYTAEPGKDLQTVFATPADLPDPVLPGGHRYLSEEVQPCLLNPAQVMDGE
ncbi:MAG: hypothetical protein LBK72_02660 [Bifidobacteriaceae bacterium]|nr:hypothetical protein [Bifidobacteriaceae bacterium]